MTDEAFTQTDMRHFMEDIFAPHLERVDRHIEADDRRFETLNQLVNRVTTSIEVSTAVQQAQLAQTERVFRSYWIRAAVGAAVLSPIVAASIAVLK